MKRIFDRHGFLAYICLCICFMAACLAAVPARAEVTTVQEAFGDADTVYVAGCPNRYPIEYYDKESESYQGVLPQVLERVSQQTGLQFVYISGNGKDERARLAANGQVQLVSAVTDEDSELLQSLAARGGAVLIHDKDGQKIGYGFGYTDIASPQLQQAVEQSLQTITAGELFDMALAQTELTPTKGIETRLVIAGAAVLLLLMALAHYFSYRRRKKLEREIEEAEKIKRGGLDTWAAFETAYQQQINSDTKAAYVMAYISFDVESTSRSYGVSAVERQLLFAANELAKLRQEGEMMTRHRSGFLLTRTAGRESAQSWVESLLKVLNGGENAPEKTASTYFRAGMYMLQESDHNCEMAAMNARQSFFEAQRTNADVVFCTPALLNKVKERLQIAQDAAMGFERKEFQLYLQLLVHTKNGRLAGAEALSRWEHPTRGLLQPGAFVEALAESGSIRQLDLYIFNEVCRQLEKWKKENVDLFISVNFTRSTIDNFDFTQELLSIANRYDFNHAKLVMEITEDTIERDRGQARANINICKQAGFTIALDDVGSGATCFADLWDYPIELMKIDRSILLGATDRRGRNLLAGMIRLAQELKIAVLCEGVETPEQEVLLQSLGCNLTQGYLHYRPMPLAVVEEQIYKERQAKQEDKSDL